MKRGWVSWGVLVSSSSLALTSLALGACGSDVKPVRHADDGTRAINEDAGPPAPLARDTVDDDASNGNGNRDSAGRGDNGAADLRLLALLEPVFGGARVTAWMAPGGQRFALTSSEGPAKAYHTLFPALKGPALAALRTVQVTDVWTARQGRLLRVAHIPTASGPTECPEDGPTPCFDVELQAEAESDGTLTLRGGNCAATMAAMAAAKPDGTPEDAFDRIVLRSVCDNAQRWAYARDKFAVVKGAAPASATPLAVVSGFDAAVLIVAPLAQGSQGEFAPRMVWHASESDRSTAFGLVARVQAQGQDRSLATHEVWLADSSGMSVVFSANTGLRSAPCAPALPKPDTTPEASRKNLCALFELDVRVEEGAVIVEDPRSECSEQAKSLDARDRPTVAKMCDARGRYTWDGKRFVKSTQGKVGHK